MPLGEDERRELELLEARFGTMPEGICEIMLQGDGVYAVTFDASLVEEDERLEYLGKFDDTAPGKRVGPCLGMRRDYDRLLDLRRKAAG